MNHFALTIIDARTEFGRAALSNQRLLGFKSCELLTAVPGFSLSEAQKWFLKGKWVNGINLNLSYFTLILSRPAQVAQWLVCRTHDLVAVCSIPGWGELSFRCSPTSAEACEKSSRWLWKEKLCLYCCEKARKHNFVTDRPDMTLAVKVALNSNTTSQLSYRELLKYLHCRDLAWHPGPAFE